MNILVILCKCHVSILGVSIIVAIAIAVSLCLIYTEKYPSEENEKPKCEPRNPSCSEQLETLREEKARQEAKLTQQIQRERGKGFQKNVSSC